jgi:hypothetical protein
MMRKCINIFLSCTAMYSEQIIIVLYLVFVFGCSISSDLYGGQKLFLFSIAPAFVIFETKAFCGFISSGVKFNIFIYLQNYMNYNKILTGALFYIFILVCSSSIYPHFKIAWMEIFLYFGCSVFLFTSISSRVFNGNVVDPRFLFFLLSIIFALNGLFNLFLDNDRFAAMTSLSEYRFYPRFGIVADHYPTTSSFTYGLYAVFSLCCYPYLQSKLSKFISVASTIILFLCIALAQSRGPFAALILVSFLYLSIRAGYYFNASNYYIILKIFLASSFLLLVLFLFLQRGLSHREEIWINFIKLALDRPILGYGERIQFRVDDNAGDLLGHAHNIFISSLLRGGLLCMVALVYMFHRFYVVSKKHFINTQDFLPCGVLIYISFAVMFDYDLIISIVDWQWFSFWLPFGYFCALESSVNKSDT